MDSYWEMELVLEKVVSLLESLQRIGFSRTESMKWCVEAGERPFGSLNQLICTMIVKEI